MKVHGRCHCGSVTYEADAEPAKAQVCHCTDCQRLSGAPYRVALPVPRASFHLLSGTPKTYLKTADSGNKRVQAFCGNCGSPIYSTSNDAEPAVYSLRVGCLDEREQLPPQRQIWCTSAMDWARDLQDVPQVARQ